MINYDYTVTVTGNTAKLDKDIYLFRGNKNVHYYFAIKNASFNFKGSTDLIEKTNAINAAVTVIKPNGVEVANAIAAVENGKIHLKVTEDLIDEEVEVGDFDLVFDLFDDTDGAVTIPKVQGQFHVLERPCTTPISELVVTTNTTNEVDLAIANYAIATYAEPVTSTNADGTFAKKTWVAKEKITTAELNRMEEGIYNNSSQYKDIAKQIEIIGQPTEEQINTSVNNALKNGNVKCDSNYNNPFENLNIVLFGDSLTDLENNNITKWVQPFRNLITCKSFKDYARGYCTWTFKSDSSYNITDSSDSNVGNNVIWNQFNKLKNDVNNGTVNTPDVIMILAGTNDALQSIALGDINTTFSSSSQGTDITQLTTLAQSVRYVCDDIYKTYPNCKIIICTPLPIGTASGYPKSVEVRNMLISCANVLNLDIIDQTYRSGIVWYREAQSNIYYRGDGVHLNDLGGELIANFIYKELLNLPCFYEKTVKSINLSTVEPTKILNSITATFTQGDNVIYTTDSLDTLKQYLVVKANYNDNTSENITSYILSGSLSVGTSVITVSYNNKTTTFNVIVTKRNVSITTTNYLRDELVRTFKDGIWEDSVMIPNLAIPNNGEVISFDCYSQSSGDFYVFLATKSDGNKFTPFYVKQYTLSVGENSIDINYTPNNSITEYYVGFKTVVRNTLGLNMDRTSATSTNQQFNEYYYKEDSSYVPEVNKVIDTQGIHNRNIGIAFDCLLKVAE